MAIYPYFIVRNLNYCIQLATVDEPPSLRTLRFLELSAL